jgi:hypothetical protein
VILLKSLLICLAVPTSIGIVVQIDNRMLASASTTIFDDHSSNNLLNFRAGLGPSDGEVHQFLTSEESFPEVVALAFRHNNGD